MFKFLFKISTHYNMDQWVFLSFLATFAASLITILIRYLNQYGEKKYLEMYMLFAFLLINVFMVCYFVIYPNKFYPHAIKKNINVFFILLSICVLALVVVYCSSRAHMIAPNPAYSSAIINSNMVIVLFLSMLLFKSPIHFKPCLGMGLVLLGVVLISSHQK